jgi:ABC-type nickel/cobalt efflux system permease component RcnA
MTQTTALLTLAALVLLGLLGWLGWLLLRLRRQQQRRMALDKALDDHNQTEHEHRRKSIELISMAALAGDCDLSEACIRIRNLIGFYPGLIEDPRFRVIDRMFEEIREFDTHQERNALPARERSEQDRRRIEIEGRYRKDLLASLVTLRECMIELRGSAYDIDLATGVRE